VTFSDTPDSAFHFRPVQDSELNYEISSAVWEIPEIKAGRAKGIVLLPLKARTQNGMDPGERGEGGGR
jgi:hypothetical protein